nr:MAG TPA: hypothetical protein [Caudoviricetes sp.]
MCHFLLLFCTISVKTHCILWLDFNSVYTHYIFQRYTVFIPALLWRHSIFRWLFLRQFSLYRIVCPIASIYYHVSAIFVYYLYSFHRFSLFTLALYHIKFYKTSILTPFFKFFQKFLRNLLIMAISPYLDIHHFFSSHSFSSTLSGNATNFQSQMSQLLPTFRYAPPLGRSFALRTFRLHTIFPYFPMPPPFTHGNLFLLLLISLTPPPFCKILSLQPLPCQPKNTPFLFLRAM